MFYFILLCYSFSNNLCKPKNLNTSYLSNEIFLSTSVRNKWTPIIDSVVFQIRHLCVLLQSCSVSFPIILRSITKSNNDSNVYSLFLSVFYSIYNFCTDRSSENIGKILFEPHRMVCIYRHEAKLMCTTTFDKEECAGRQTGDTSPAFVTVMKFLQGAHRIKTLSLQNNRLR